jgi:hypothetical protein
MLVLLVVIVVAVGVVLGVSGVLHFQNTRDKAGLTIDKKEIREKTENAVNEAKEAGGKVLDKTGQALHKAAAGLRESPPDRPPAATPAPDDHNTRQPETNQIPAKNP